MLVDVRRAHPGLAVVVLATTGQEGPAGWPGADAVLSKPPGQSRFLEAVRDALGGRPGVLVPPPEPPAPAPTGRRLRVLVAEDNPINQVVASALLAKLGHSARIAGDGREALAALAEEPFDVVFMDVQMPDMDGVTATAELRRREAGTGRRVPVIALTAHALKGDRERLLAACMDDYLSKPIRPEELARVLASLPAG
jgi:CheY-like chemotaxis protein